ncbi:hypothetical protein HAX54_012349 [Datura stramonium]|uniref:Gnk2-homologous domain-containing protein n=1 Tax=Datura stramonium TaxID=4076 RepID=A0ABS8TJP5_DATST|nr:hypothetical protein [Datura stramonium]
MASLKLISCLFFLSPIAIFAQTVISEPIFHICSIAGTFQPDSPYAQNLKVLLEYLNLKTPPTGFFTSSVGIKPDKVYGLSICRGDVSSATCKLCVTDASQQIRKRCPFNKEAIIWYDYCLVKYSDECFKGEIDNKNQFNWWNGTVTNPETFNLMTKELMGCLAERASSVPDFFATREIDIEKGQKLYGLVQCTRDLSKEDCKKCLDGNIAELSNCCAGKRGARVVGGSCIVRYETYPFFKAPQKLEYIIDA